MAELHWSFPWKDDPDFCHIALRRDNGVYYYRRWNRHKKGYETQSYATTDPIEAQKIHVKRHGKKFLSAEVRRLCCGDEESGAFAGFLGSLREMGYSEATIHRYRCAWRNDIVRHLSGTPVVEVEHGELQRLLNRAGERASQTSAGLLSDSALEGIRAVLGSFFRYCKKEHYRPDNPAHGLDLPRRTADEGEDEREMTFSPEEVVRIAGIVGTPATTRAWDVIMAYKRLTLVLLSVEIGTRIGETLAIQIPDVELDSEDPEVRINKQVNFQMKAGDPSTWFIYRTKSKKKKQGWRKVPLSTRAVALLREYIERGQTEGWLLEDGLLFPSRAQTPIAPTRIARTLAKASKAVGGRDVHSHLFRHTFISNHLEAGTKRNWVAEYAGNSEKVVYDTYEHPLNRKRANAENRDRVARWQEEQAPPAASNVIEFRSRRRAG